MTPRPFHRWKFFWFGLLVLAFLGGSWLRSYARVSALEITTPEACYVLGTFPGAFAFVELPFGKGTGLDLDWINKPVPADEVRIWFAPWYEATTVLIGGSVSIAHWFVILLFLIPWTALLLWRGRRLKRLAAASVDPQA